MNQPATFTRISGMLPHPNADSLSIIQVEDLAYQILGRTDEWKVGDYCVYIEPDSIVPDTPEFEWLGAKPKYRRIRAKNIRGLHSFGLLTKPDTLFGSEGFRGIPAIGTDVSEELSIEHWQPPGQFSEGSNEAAEYPLIAELGKFSVENIQREGALIDEGTLVVVREKIHGQNARFVYAKDRGGQYRLFCGKRTWWVQPGKDPIWNMASPEIRQMCSEHPDVIFYAELTPCQGEKWTYGGEPRVTFFAARDTRSGRFETDAWVSSVVNLFNLRMAPYILTVTYDREAMTKFGQGTSKYPDQEMREGIVIQKALHEGQPVFLKSINPEYLAR